MLRLAVIVIAVCFFSNSALHAETWRCAYHIIGGPPGSSGRAAIEIGDKELKWVTPAYSLPSVNAYVGAGVVKLAVLENNSLGLVAVSPESRKDKDAGPIIGAFVMVLEKSSGALHEGSISTIGSSDALTGTCRRT